MSDVEMLDTTFTVSDDRAVGTANRTKATSSATTAAAPARPSTNASANAAPIPSSPINLNVKKDKVSARPNPLAKYSSYTYQISLYMITPDVYDKFTSSGRTNINLGEGVFLVVQSGGIGGDIPRAPGFKYDYYIDDLKILTNCSAQSTGGAQTLSTEISFNIYEPYGFSFMTNLRKSFEQMKAISKTPNITDASNVWKQFYIMGLRFLGYDKDGNVMPIEIEKYYDININEVSFKIDGKMVVYSCKAINLPFNTGFGTKRGMVDLGATIVGSNVREALIGNNPSNYGLLSKLNKDQQDLVSKNPPSAEFPIKYSVEFVKNDNGDDGNEIANSKIVSKADTDKSKVPFTPVKNTVNVNVSAEEKATFDPTKRMLVFKNETPIVQAITQIILQSDYIESAMKIYKVEEQTDPKTKKPETVEQNTNKTVKWFSIWCEASNPRWDKIRKDFVFDIKYKILPYNTPATQTSYASNTGDYPGAVKRYDFWYTGKNSEITRFEQTLNNAYYMVALDPNISGTGAAYGLPGADISQAPNKTSNESRIGKSGDAVKSMAAQNNYVTSILDPGSWAEAKIEILGDPEYLMTELITNPATGEYNYANELNSSLGAQSGQIFVEIDFKEPVDYNGQTGVMDINQSINFVNYPPAIQQQVEGISYKLVELYSTFVKGSFKQTLSLVLNLFGDQISNKSQSAAQVSVSREGQVTVQETQQPQDPNKAGLTNAPPPPDPARSNNTPQPPTNTAATSTQRTIATRTGQNVATDETAPRAKPIVAPSGREEPASAEVAASFGLGI